MRNVLVIGGSGYIGSVLVPELLSKGFNVRVLDSLIYGNASSLAHLNEHKNFSFMKGDFCNRRDCELALDGVTDVVLLAAMVGDPICKKYPELANRTNVLGPTSLFEILKKSSIDKFIFTSTCSNYGLRSDDTPAKEDSELNPVSLYAETKVNFENYIINNLPYVKFCPVILRLSTAFGIAPRMRFDLTVSEFTRELSLGKKLLVFDENTWRPYCHVSDISKAILLSLEAEVNKVRGEVFNVGSTAGNFTKKMIVNVISQNLKSPEIEYKLGGNDPRNYKVDFEKINRVLNFKAGYTVEQNVKSLILAIQNGFFNDVDLRKNFYGNYEVIQ